MDLNPGLTPNLEVMRLWVRILTSLSFCLENGHIGAYCED